MSKFVLLSLWGDGGNDPCMVKGRFRWCEAENMFSLSRATTFALSIGYRLADILFMSRLFAQELLIQAIAVILPFKIIISYPYAGLSPYASRSDNDDKSPSLHYLALGGPRSYCCLHDVEKASKS